jgi:cytochrome c biogenesis protein CcmG/thiol:disulfide interchange protein DsbE
VLPDLRDPRRVRASSDLFGTPSVVTFLASTCVPCRTELPILQALADRYAGRVAVLGIAHLEFRERALPFIEELGISFPVAHDEAGGTAVGWFVPSLPATFFLDREGRVVKAAVGPATREELESGVEAILR